METSGGAGVGAVSPLPGPNTTTSTIDEAADHEASHPPVTFLAPAHSTDPLTCGSSTRNGAEHGAGTHGSADSTSPDRYQVQFVEIGTRKLGMVVENCSDVNVVVDLHHDNDGRSQARELGVQCNDVIVSIDDQDVHGWRLEDIVACIKSKTKTFRVGFSRANIAGGKKACPEGAASQEGAGGEQTPVNAQMGTERDSERGAEPRIEEHRMSAAPQDPQAGTSAPPPLPVSVAPPSTADGDSRPRQRAPSVTAGGVRRETQPRQQEEGLVAASGQEQLAEAGGRGGQGGGSDDEVEVVGVLQAPRSHRLPPVQSAMGDSPQASKASQQDKGHHSLPHRLPPISARPQRHPQELGQVAVGYQHMHEYQQRLQQHQQQKQQQLQESQRQPTHIKPLASPLGHGPVSNGGGPLGRDHGTRSEKLRSERAGSEGQISTYLRKIVNAPADSTGPWLEERGKDMLTQLVFKGEEDLGTDCEVLEMESRTAGHEPIQSQDRNGNRMGAQADENGKEPSTVQQAPENSTVEVMCKKRKRGSEMEKENDSSLSRGSGGRTNDVSLKTSNNHAIKDIKAWYTRLRDMRLDCVQLQLDGNEYFRGVLAHVHRLVEENGAVRELLKKRIMTYRMQCHEFRMADTRVDKAPLARRWDELNDQYRTHGDVQKSIHKLVTQLEQAVGELYPAVNGQIDEQLYLQLRKLETIVGEIGDLNSVLKEVSQAGRNGHAAGARGETGRDRRLDEGEGFGWEACAGAGARVAHGAALCQIEPNNLDDEGPLGCHDTNNSRLSILTSPPNPSRPLSRAQPRAHQGSQEGIYAATHKFEHKRVLLGANHQLSVLPTPYAYDIPYNPQSAIVPFRRVQIKLKGPLVTQVGRGDGLCRWKPPPKAVGLPTMAEIESLLGQFSRVYEAHLLWLIYETGWELTVARRLFMEKLDLKVAFQDKDERGHPIPFLDRFSQQDALEFGKVMADDWKNFHLASRMLKKSTKSCVAFYYSTWKKSEAYRRLKMGNERAREANRWREGD